MFFFLTYYFFSIAYFLLFGWQAVINYGRCGFYYKCDEHTHIEYTEVFILYFMIGKPVSQRQSGLRMGYSAGQPQSPLSVSHPGFSFDERPGYEKPSPFQF